MLPLLIPAAVQGLMGLWQTSQSMKGLNELNKTPFPEVQEAPELRSAYTRMNAASQYGFSPEQTAAYRQDVAQQGNMAYRQGVDMGGGNMARALNAGIGAMNLGASNKFAQQGAGLQLQKMRYSDTLAQALQHQLNLKQQAAIHHRTMLEQAYGHAQNMGLTNIMGGAMTSGLGLYSGQSQGGAAGASGLRGMSDGKGYTDTLDNQQPNLDDSFNG